ncbi:hypothetical protein EDB19DRAFT_136798 [Suillus lakei]|nr:hypothetical protein EDB19DRAFT_136798 [Suillus lakei]
MPHHACPITYCTVPLSYHHRHKPPDRYVTLRYILHVSCSYTSALSVDSHSRCASHSVLASRHFTAAVLSSSLLDDVAPFQLSIKSKSVYARWVTKYAVRSARWIKAVTLVLDAFFLAHPEMANLSEVLSAHLRLLEVQEDGSTLWDVVVVWWARWFLVCGWVWRGRPRSA